MVSHLEFYTQHDISPVQYDLSNLAAHFQRREALYRTLGILPLTIRGANVLEVATGTGQNSLYISSLRPASLTLVEPNPAGIRNIRASYETFSAPHVKPTIIEAKLEDYDPGKTFDIVICENWLGASPHERKLLGKLAGLVAPRGILVLTCVSPIGLLPNVIRRALALRVAERLRGFEERTGIIAEAFGSHLATLEHMTRSVIDWVHDNMLNPAYFDLCLTVPMVLADLGAQFQAVGVSPDFRRDWRWFKSIHGAGFDFNRVFIEEYFRNCHCFVDYRAAYAERDAKENRELEAQALALVDQVRRIDGDATKGFGASKALSDELISKLHAVGRLLRDVSPGLSEAVLEAVNALESRSLSSGDVAGLSGFSRWFGRETLYISLERTAVQR